MILKFIVSEAKKAATSVIMLVSIASVIVSMLFFACLVSGLFLWTISFGMVEGVISPPVMGWDDIVASGGLLLMVGGGLAAIINWVFNFVIQIRHDYAAFKQEHAT